MILAADAAGYSRMMATDETVQCAIEAQDDLGWTAAQQLTTSRRNAFLARAAIAVVAIALIDLLSG